MPKKKYPDSLNAPLGPPTTILGTENFDDADQDYQAEIAKRYELLMEHYDIDPNAPAKWERLARSLAEHHVPGLRPWKPDVDPDRHARILFRMLYLIEVRGFAEKSAADALSSVCQDLGNAEAIRSSFREQEKHPDLKHLRDFFTKAQSAVAPEAFESSLVEAIGEDIALLQGVKLPSRGRPPKK